MRHYLFLLFLFLSQTASAQTAASQDSVYNDVEQIAEFPGGYAGLSAYFRQFFPIPMTKHTRSWVNVRVVVGRDGHIGKIEILKNPGTAETAEKVRAAIRKMPLWRPAILQGRTVSSRVIFPVRFCLKE